MVLGRRELSAILLAVAAILFYLLLLSTTPSGAQTNGNEGCSNPEPVDTFTGTENQITPDFEITGDTFRLSYETELIDQDVFGSLDITVLDEDGDPVDFAFLTNDPDDDADDSDSTNILEGPGTFALEIDANNIEYAITVEDCTGTDQNGGNTTNQNPTVRNPTTANGNDSPQNRPQRERTRDVVNIPNRPLPPSGGLPVYGVVAGFVLTGASLLALGLVIRRATQR